MICCSKFIYPWLVVFFVGAVAGSKSANAQGKLNAYYMATLLGLPIGHIAWAVDLKENHFSSKATGSQRWCLEDSRQYEMPEPQPRRERYS